MIPSARRAELIDLAARLMTEASGLEAGLPDATRAPVARLLAHMNGYYSNLIEGHFTQLQDIERVAEERLDTNPERRKLQQQHAAHLAAQRNFEQKLASEAVELCSPHVLRWIHYQFQSQLPEEFRSVGNTEGTETTPVEPGELRRRGVHVGRHVPPVPEALEACLQRFKEAYDPTKQSYVTGPIAAAASHHRLLWIHPFLDGNGRVARLFSQAYLSRVGVKGQGLWTLSRGLSLRVTEYKSTLARADEERHGDLDGRGNLTDEGLADFCYFFLEVCLDQVRFMQKLLRLEEFVARAAALAEKLVRREAAPLIREVIYRGSIERGEAATLMNMSASSAREVTSKLLEIGLLSSASSRQPLRLDLPPKWVAELFPSLYLIR